MKSNLINIAVVGGGAAGFFAAIKSAEENPQARVVIFEKGAHVLTKVRISGGGRCNVTNACFESKKLVANYPRGGQALLGPFHKFQPTDTVKWFENRGVPLKTEEDGRIFPTTDSSVTIINALKGAAQAAGVIVRTYAGPTGIQTQGPRQFQLNFANQENVHCERLLLATGNSAQGWKWAREMGHTIEPPVPSLFTFTIPDERLKGLAGISVEAANLHVVGTDLHQKGPLLITHWGISGPAVLKLSAWGARALYDKGYQAEIGINWIGLDREKAMDRLHDFKITHPRKQINGHSPFPIPFRLWERLVHSTHLPAELTWSNLSNIQMGRLADVLCVGRYVMRGKSTFKDEFVTCGGVRLNEIDFRTMESRVCSDLYFAGEIIDVDGITGGFNFQSAWTTGWLAGIAMSKL